MTNRRYTSRLKWPTRRRPLRAVSRGAGGVESLDQKSQAGEAQNSVIGFYVIEGSNTMKKLLVIMAALFILSSAALAKKKQKLPEFTYDRTGQIIHHAEVRRYALDGRNDLYNSGDYICTPGDEHNAPTCQTYVDWFVTAKAAYDEVLLDDGSVLIIPLTAHPTCGLDRDKKCSEPWNRTDKTTVVTPPVELQLRLPHEYATDASKAVVGSKTFHYAIDQGGVIHVDPRDSGWWASLSGVPHLRH